MDPVYIENCECIRKTDAAVLVEVEGEQEVWIPKSQLHDDNEINEEGDAGILVVSKWFAEKAGIA